jgi:signal transduction histidine kinase
MSGPSYREVLARALALARAQGAAGPVASLSAVLLEAHLTENRFAGDDTDAAAEQLLALVGRLLSGHARRDTPERDGETPETMEARFALEKTVAELDLANRQLHEMDHLKSQFFANMSHELRTPLNSIIGFTEDLRDGLAGPLNERQLRYVSKVIAAGRHLLSLINEVLDLSKLRAGRTQLERRPVHIAQALHDAADTMLPLLQRKGQQVTIDAPPDLPAVHADPGKLHQILLNLVSNAHKFTGWSGRMKLQARRLGEMVQVDVTDDGIGIPEADIPNLFQEFRPIDTQRRPRQQGAGLGLAITRRLVELHGGDVDARSELGRGTTISFTLPCTDQRQEDADP